MRPVSADDVPGIVSCIDRNGRSSTEYVGRSAGLENEINHEGASVSTRWTMIRILLADDQEAVRRALRLLLEQVASYVIVGEVQDAGDLREALASRSPDVVLLDWELPGLDAEGLLPLVHPADAAIRVIAMSSRPEAQEAARSAGVDACISKGKPAEQVLAAIHNVLGGGE